MQASASNNTALNENDLARLGELENEVANGGEYFRLKDGQSQEVIFDIKGTPGMTKRTISTKEGDKELNRFAFLIWNPTLKKNQLFELAPRWVSRAISAIKDFQTTTLIVKRKGSTISDTEYNFLPPGLANWSPSK